MRTARPQLYRGRMCHLELHRRDQRACSAEVVWWCLAMGVGIAFLALV